MNELQKVEARMNEIVGLIEKATDVSEIEKLTKEHEGLTEKRSILLKAASLKPVEVSQRSATPLPNPEVRRTDVPLLESMEYRSAFRNHVLTGKDNELIQKARLEARADATTFTTDISAIIPTTIMNRVIESLKDYGDIWPRITKMNVKAGIEFPIAGAKPTASWVAEGTTAEKQKKTVTGKVSFLWHKLQIKMAATLEATLVSLDVFEGIIARNMAEAIVVALEEAVFNGTGSGQPLGILVDTRVLAGQKHNFLATDATWKGWKTKFFSKIPSAHRKKNKGVILVDYGTWDTYMDGMEDDNGQPVARTNYGINGEEQLRFNGYTVIPVPYLKSYDDATVGDVFLVYMDLAEYAFNSQLNITYRKYYDEDTDEYVEKLTLIGDGKLLDVEGIVMLKKAIA